MLKNIIQKFIKFNNSLCLLLAFILIGSVTSFAIPPSYSSSIKPDGWMFSNDYLNVQYDPLSKVLSWNGSVTLSNGCMSLVSQSMSPIYYLVTPKPSDPVFNHKLVIKSFGEICTQSVMNKLFSGSLNNVSLSASQLLNFSTTVSLSWSDNTIKPPSNLWENINLKKLNWIEKDPISIKAGFYNLTLEGTFLYTEPKKSECISFRRGMLGWYCKRVIAKAANPMFRLPTKIITNPADLRYILWSINSLEKAHFMADVLRGNGWDKGEVMYQGKYLTRMNNECTTDVSYYQVLATNNSYELKPLKTEVDSSITALCE
jgi:hypothetical protein